MLEVCVWSAGALVAAVQTQCRTERMTCTLSVKDDPYGSNNMIGINVGSWLNLETWIFDSKFFMPCTSSDANGDVTIWSATGNYQRGELGTVREINRVASSSAAAGSGGNDWATFNGNIPPPNRVEPPQGGRKH